MHRPLSRSVCNLILAVFPDMVFKDVQNGDVSWSLTDTPEGSKWHWAAQEPVPSAPRPIGNVRGQNNPQIRHDIQNYFFVGFILFLGMLGNDLGNRHSFLGTVSL